jgi:quercetin dioxygenase-like cupin family protein
MTKTAMNEAAHDDTITVGALGVRFLVEAGDSNGTASVFECYVPANAQMPAPQSHDGFEGTVYGLEGVTTWTIDGHTVEIGPSDAVCVPRGQIHGLEKHGNVDATLLAITTAAAFASANFREIEQALAAAGGPPNLAAISAVMRRHRLTPTTQAPPDNSSPTNAPQQKASRPCSRS